MFLNDIFFIPNLNLRVVTLRSILEGEEDILLVARNEGDGGIWQFLNDESFKDEEACVVTMKEILEIDPRITQLSKLQPGWMAIRSSIVHAWFYKRINY